MDYSYEMFQDGINDIVEQIDSSEPSHFDYVIGLTRGGLIPAVVLSHRLDVPMLALNFQTRDSNLRHIPNKIKNILKNKNVLIVEDIIDSGETLTLLIKEFDSFCNYKIAALIYNDEQKIDCNYFNVTISRSVNSDWINFWWE